MLLLLKKMYLHLFTEDICGELLILLFKNPSLNVQLWSVVDNIPVSADGKYTEKH